MNVTVEFSNSFGWGAFCLYSPGELCSIVFPYKNFLIFWNFASFLKYLGKKLPLSGDFFLKKLESCSYDLGALPHTPLHGDDEALAIFSAWSPLHIHKYVCPSAHLDARQSWASRYDGANSWQNSISHGEKESVSPHFLYVFQRRFIILHCLGNYFFKHNKC